jgi:hypothetical protein
VPLRVSTLVREPLKMITQSENYSCQVSKDVNSFYYFIRVMCGNGMVLSLSLIIKLKTLQATTKYIR